MRCTNHSVPNWWCLTPDCPLIDRKECVCLVPNILNSTIIKTESLMAIESYLVYPGIWPQLDGNWSLSLSWLHRWSHIETHTIIHPLNINGMVSVCIIIPILHKIMYAYSACNSHNIYPYSITTTKRVHIHIWCTVVSWQPETIIPMSNAESANCRPCWLRHKADTVMIKPFCKH